MSVPVTTDLPSSCRRVAWPGRLGPIAAVVGSPAEPLGQALLIPGYTGSMEDYFAILDPLVQRGWAVAAADLPGMSGSAGPADPDHYTLEQFADDVLGMIASCGGEPVHLVGHSIGGIVAREAVLRDPSRIASLTLYDSGPAAVGTQAARDAQALLTALQYASPGDVYLLKEGIDAEAGREVPRGPVAQFLRQRWADTSAGHLIGMGQIAIGAPDRTVALAALSQALQLPVLVLYGALDDQIWSLADFAHLANRVASRTVVIPDSGHSPAVEAPEEMVRELDAFWRALT